MAALTASTSNSVGRLAYPIRVFSSSATHATSVAGSFPVGSGYGGGSRAGGRLRKRVSVTQHNASPADVGLVNCILPPTAMASVPLIQPRLRGLSLHQFEGGRYVRPKRLY